MAFGYLAGALLMVPLFVMMILPFLNGSFDSANLDNTIKTTDPAWGGLQLSIVWLWLMCWSAWGVDVCATFAPEYKDTARDTKLALRSAALFSLFVYILLPIGFVGGGTADLVSAYDYVGAMNLIVGSTTLTDFFVVCLVAAFIITMNTATADGGRALYGISRAGMTVKQLGRLNRYHVPGNAMTVDMAINILFVLFIGNIFGVLAASNLGYVLAHMFALSGFVILRRMRPNWPRPIKLGAIWVPIAAYPRGVVRSFSPWSASAGCRSRLADTATRRRRSSACPSSSSASSSSSSDGSCRTGSGRTGVRRRRRCRTPVKRRSSPRRCARPSSWLRCRSKRRGSGRASSLVVRITRMEGSRPPEFEVAMESAIASAEAFGASYDVAPASDALELGEGLEGDPAVAFRRTLGMFATGVTVLTARVGEQVHGMTANAFMSVSLQPPLVLISIDRRARMGALLHEGTRFGVSVLEARQTGLSDRFAGRTANDPPEATFELVHETPLVEGALAHLVARVVRSYWGGDHSLFLGQVEFARYGEGRPLLFHGGRYERLIEDPQVFSLLPRELLDPILALGRGARVRGRRADHADRGGRLRPPARARRRGTGRTPGPVD